MARCFKPFQDFFGHKIIYDIFEIISIHATRKDTMHWMLMLVISSVPFLLLSRRFIIFQDLAYVIELRDILSSHPCLKYFCDESRFQTPSMWIIYIFDCLFISEWRISEKTNAWKFKQWNDINARSLCITDKFKPVNTMFGFIEHLISEGSKQGWSLSKAILWRKSTRAEMDLLLHFRSGGFVPYFHSLTKRLEFFSTNVVALENGFEIYLLIYFCGLLHSVI